MITTVVTVGSRGAEAGARPMTSIVVVTAETSASTAPSEEKVGLVAATSHVESRNSRRVHVRRRHHPSGDPWTSFRTPCCSREP